MKYLILIILLTATGFTPAASAQVFRTQELDVQFHRAKTAFETGNSLFEAKARIDRVLAGVPGDTEALKLRAAILMGLQRPEEALDDALVAVRLDHSDGEAQLLLCETSQASGNPELAASALATASDLIIENIDHLVRLSWCAVELEDLIRAESLARISIAQDDADTRGYLQLARVFFRSGDEDALQNLLEGALKNFPNAMNLIEEDPGTYSHGKQFD